MNATPELIRPEAPPPPMLLESPLWRFEVQCLACGSYQIRLQPQGDAATGKFCLWLVCQRCQHREPLAW